jgi:hypothetical protein
VSLLSSASAASHAAPLHAAAPVQAQAPAQAPAPAAQPAPAAAPSTPSAAVSGTQGSEAGQPGPLLPYSPVSVRASSCDLEVSSSERLLRARLLALHF